MESTWWHSFPKAIDSFNLGHYVFMLLLVYPASRLATDQAAQHTELDWWRSLPDNCYSRRRVCHLAPSWSPGSVLTLNALGAEALAIAILKIAAKQTPEGMFSIYN